MRAIVFYFALALCGLCQTINLADEQSQTDLKSAKRIVVLIQTGPTLPSPYPPDLERARKQVKEKLGKWKKFTVVADSKNADLVLVITEFNQNFGVTASASTFGNTTVANARDRNCLADEIRVYKGGKNPEPNDSPVWTRTESCGFSWPLNRALDQFWKKAR